MRKEIREVVKIFLAPDTRIPDGAEDEVNIRLRQLKQALKSRGRDYLIAHYNGVAISRAETMTAQCCECMGYHTEGLKDCEMRHCKFYQWMPYGTMVKRYIRKAK